MVKTTSFYTGGLGRTPSGTLVSQWYNVARQSYWYMDRIDLLHYYHAYHPERPEMAEPYRVALKEMTNYERVNPTPNVA